ncbi:uncharacterized protein PHACADRAFT_177314 [Phanerochaete carnosa HHB-10118-sp]|uniref:C2H2-type domain-containing protein n=1 Tax=Phanerochaete carnosa (strain HHB-10118-sp) TaxID=650164 RepID=K5VYM1_PHACS|nr:uncharacterized protein PHACADRAFT_177314 [Phanerochaete carnosa HHB-10118-sp]EKM51905.1 hypothetical protein PHACADRAFT_177314 [Phanerochaete carnosa HHB-10118-sp]
MQHSYDSLFDDFTSFLYSPELHAKEIPLDPWYAASFHADLGSPLSDGLASGTPVSALSLLYDGSSGAQSDFYTCSGLDDFAGSPISDASSPRSLFDDPTLSPPTSIIDDRGAGLDETLALPSDFSHASTSLFAYDRRSHSSSTSQTCPSPLASVWELSNLPTSCSSSRSASPRVPTNAYKPYDTSHESDANADGVSDSESEYDDSGDSDYVDDADEDYTPRRASHKKPTHAKHSHSVAKPSPSSTSRTARTTRVNRYSPYTSPRAGSSSSASSSECGSPRTRCPQLKRTSARKEQISAPVPRTQVTSNSSKRWNCPLCDYVQKNRRRPDLKRHILGHYQEDKHVCCGVPLHLASHYGVADTAEVVEWRREDRVGGCWQVFSRRDALIRHLKNPKKKCVNHEALPSKVLKGRK